MKKMLAVVLLFGLHALVCVSPIRAQEVIAFENLLDSITTNIPAFPVTSRVPSGTEDIVINNFNVPTGNAMIFAVVSLQPGDNPITLSYVDAFGGATQTVKHVVYDPAYKTDVLELMYVNHQFYDYENPEGADQLRLGATVIDINNHVYLGILTDHHVFGVNPAGSRIFLNDGKIYSAASHTDTGASLPEYANNQPLVFSHDGKYVFYNNKKVGLETLAIVPPNLPTTITLASSMPDNDGRIYRWGGYTDLATNTFKGVGYYSKANSADVAVDPQDRFLVTTSFAWGLGTMAFHNPTTGSLYYRHEWVTQGGMDYERNIVFSRDGKVAYSCALGNPVNGHGGIVAVNLDSLAAHNNDAQVPIESFILGQNNIFALSIANDGRLFSVVPGSAYLVEYQTVPSPLSVGIVRYYSFLPPGSPLGAPDTLLINYKPAYAAPCTFIRGNANGDFAVDISDAISILFQLFVTGPTTPNWDAIDVNDDGENGLADAVYLLEHLFKTGEPPPAPYPHLGRDTTPDDIPACEEP